MDILEERSALVDRNEETQDDSEFAITSPYPEGSKPAQWRVFAVFTSQLRRARRRMSDFRQSGVGF